MSGNTLFVGRHTCDSPEWYTPSPFVEATREVMRAIDLDPASCEEANQTVKATRFFTEEDNGLEQPWGGRVFLNPPGGKGLVQSFWRKLVREFAVMKRVEQAIWIGYSLEQLQTLQNAATLTPLHFPMCVPSKRVAFIENEAKQRARIEKMTEYNRVNAAIGGKLRRVSETADSPSHANYITYMGPHVERFREVFGAFGAVRS